MENVIPFPSNAMRNWTEWVRFVRQVVSDSDVHDCVADHVIEGIRPLFDELWVEVSMSFDTTCECVAVVEEVRDRVGIAVAERDKRIMMERIKREIVLAKRLGVF